MILNKIELELLAITLQYYIIHSGDDSRIEETRELLKTVQSILDNN